MWYTNVFELGLLGPGKRQSQSARRGPGSLQKKRLRVEPLEPRALLSADLRSLDVFPDSQPGDTPAVPLVSEGVNAGSTRLYSVAWAGNGQVKMKQQGNWWGDDEFTDRGDRQTATGSAHPSWADYNGDGDAGEADEPWDPIAYKLNTKPKLKATFEVDRSYAKSIKVRAESIDGGPALVFNGSAKVTRTYAGVGLTTTNTVGGTIDNRDVTLEWYVSINGGAWQTIGSSTQRLFAVYGKPLDTSTNSPTAARVWYACYNAYGNSTRLNIAQGIADDAQNRFSTEHTYIKEAAWSVLNTGGDCGSDSWLMHNGLAAIGVSAEVRYIFPQHYNWAGLYSTTAGHNEVRRGSSARLIYVASNGGGNNYEGTLYVKEGSSKRYYLGGYGGEWEPSAYDVLMNVSGPNVSGNGAHQAWTDSWNTPVSYPTGRHPAGFAEADVFEAGVDTIILADGSLLRKRVDPPAGVGPWAVASPLGPGLLA